MKMATFPKTKIVLYVALATSLTSCSPNKVRDFYDAHLNLEKKELALASANGKVDSIEKVCENKRTQIEIFTRLSHNSKDYDAEQTQLLSELKCDKVRLEDAKKVQVDVKKESEETKFLLGLTGIAGLVSLLIIFGSLLRIKKTR